MNPIKNKKDLETTIDDIRNFAYLYLEKHSPSKQQLRTYLFKKLIFTWVFCSFIGSYSSDLIMKT